jgi:protein-tyrosine phosphatase
MRLCPLIFLQFCTMSHGLPNTPSWLQNSQNLSYVNTLLSTLGERERQRDTARRASRRHQSQPVLRVLQSAKRYHYSVAAGCANTWGNRYLDLEPYDRTRVVVGNDEEQSIVGTGGASHGRYLNASWVRELFGGKWWIATQAPLPNTAHAFLSVILQPVTRPPQLLDGSTTSQRCRVRTVVQLTKNVENDRVKAHSYFPAVIGACWTIPPEERASVPSIKVTLLETTSIPEIHCIQSTVSIVPISSTGREQDPITFRHLMYTAWPDHGVPEPEARASLLAFIHLVDRSNKDTSGQPHSDELYPDPPIMVNCSAGIGRTGSFIALSSLLRGYDLFTSGPVTNLAPLPASPLGPLPVEFKDDLVAQEVDSLREQRPGMVQRDEQLVLIYEVLAAAFP